MFMSFHLNSEEGNSLKKMLLFLDDLSEYAIWGKITSVKGEEIVLRLFFCFCFRLCLLFLFTYFNLLG